VQRGKRRTIVVALYVVKPRSIQPNVPVRDVVVDEGNDRRAALVASYASSAASTVRATVPDD
jgi:hypothetical protein